MNACPRSAKSRLSRQPAFARPMRYPFMKTHRRRLLHALLGSVLLTLLARHSIAMPALAGDPLVGRWLRTWPDDHCVVALEIRADGGMTITDGANVVEASLHRTGPADGAGIFPVSRGVTSDNGRPTCTAGPDAAPYPSGQAKSPETDSPGHVPLGAILLFAHGDAISLCGNIESGSCDHWFRRQPAIPSAARASGPAGFQAAVERGFYAVVPENPRSFELIPLASTGTGDFVASDNSSLGCDSAAGVEIVGDGFSNVKFDVASCHDTAAVTAWAKSKVRSSREATSAGGRPSADDARKYGIVATDERFGDVGELFYWYEVARGPDAALPTRSAVFVDPRRARAIVIFGIDMSMGQRAPAFGSDPLGSDPASAMKRIARAIGRAGDAAR